MLLVTYSWLRTLLREARRRRMVDHAEQLQAQGLFRGNAAAKHLLLLQEGNEGEEGLAPAAAARPAPLQLRGSGKAQQQASTMHANPLFSAPSAAQEALLTQPPPPPPPQAPAISPTSQWRLDEMAQVPVPVRRARAQRHRGLQEQQSQKH
jgi:hypothetical protein